jgi:hypothetical protein
MRRARRKAGGRCAWEGVGMLVEAGRSQVRRRRARGGAWRAGENRARPEACARARPGGAEGAGRAGAGVEELGRRARESRRGRTSRGATPTRHGEPRRRERPRPLGRGCAGGADAREGGRGLAAREPGEGDGDGGGQTTVQRQRRGRRGRARAPSGAAAPRGGAPGRELPGPRPWPSHYTEPRGSGSRQAAEAARDRAPSGPDRRAMAGAGRAQAAPVGTGWGCALARALPRSGRRGGRGGGARGGSGPVLGEGRLGGRGLDAGVWPPPRGKDEPPGGRWLVLGVEAADGWGGRRNPKPKPLIPCKNGELLDVLIIDGIQYI